MAAILIERAELESRYGLAAGAAIFEEITKAEKQNVAYFAVAKPVRDARLSLSSEGYARAA